MFPLIKKNLYTMYSDPLEVMQHFYITIIHTMYNLQVFEVCKLSVAPYMLFIMFKHIL